MSELLPSLQANRTRESVLDYLTTTFALADGDAQAALREFLNSDASGLFKGPYLRLRLPYRSAGAGWQDFLEWDSGLVPYGHQAAAFERLSSHNLSEAKARPLPTVITTGTGSGKTEAFLYPIIDHILRAKRAGIAGTKAIVLYPMNALANDQASRLAELLSTHDELAGITAALYTGHQGPKRKRVTDDGLITDRATIRQKAPDLMLTNYKMLDQLLLRADDASLWQQSAQSLQYLVLDEFHTYDGAQGTDVAMLLRRLGMAIKSHWSDTGAATAEDKARPLGRVTPVATSATLGDDGDPAAMLRFAETVFGDTFGPDSVVTESRVGLDEWVTTVGGSAVGPPQHPAPGAALVSPATLDAIVTAAADLTDGAEISAVVLGHLYSDQTGPRDLAAATPEQLLELTAAHPLTRHLLERTAQAVALTDLVEHNGGALASSPRSAATEFLLLFVATLTHVRKDAGRSAVSVDLHLWIRELTRIDRIATGSPRFRWSDDLHVQQDADDETDDYSAVSAFPAIYCRHCGRSGWGVLRAPVGGFDLDVRDTNIRRAHLLGNHKFRALIHAPNEGGALDSDVPAAQRSDPPVHWFYPDGRRVDPARPTDEADAQAGRVLPVLVHTGQDADKLSVDDTCPHCEQRGGIRFMGSAIATLLSVSLSTLFGTPGLDDAEKKALVFTDSVQDAAHRAGFIQSRSHNLTLRAVLRAAITDVPRNLNQVVDSVLALAGSDPHLRYRLLPPEVAHRDVFVPYWDPAEVSDDVHTIQRVRRRLQFDAVMEFGLNSRVGRTLEVTASATAYVDANPQLLARLAKDVLEDVPLKGEVSQSATDESRLLGWVRGVLERMRERGAIEHEWFERYQAEDGNRHSIWGGRPRSHGMPAFPGGRAAPAYPRVGNAKVAKGSDLDPVASPRSWYAMWASRVLGLAPADAAVVARELFAALAKADVVRMVNSNSGAKIYRLPPESVHVVAVSDGQLASAGVGLVCGVCEALTPAAVHVHAELLGMPCLIGRCTGTLSARPGSSENFYRAMYATSNIRRIVAHEHTGLLDDDTRLLYEGQFKRSADTPDAPNVLVATPTLEMNIDSGDLSTVMLASLPKTVASYLQRVGRAGRMTGSALNLAFVSGRGEQLPRLGDPLSVVNGQVRPPATYLNAEGIMRRQYLASLVDRTSRNPSAPHPRTATEAIASVSGGSFLGTIADEAATSISDGHLEGFIASFETIGQDAAERLRMWVVPGSGGALSSGLGQSLTRASQQWAAEVDMISERIKAIEATLPDLKAVADSPAKTDEDEIALRTAQSADRVNRSRLGRLRGEHWIGVLEQHGVLPNYTLLDDSVTLDITVNWRDAESQQFVAETFSVSRGASIALRELAPGSTFYARGLRVEIDAVELGHQGQAIYDWLMCPDCGFGVQLEGQPRPSECPRCGSRGIADVQQQLQVVELDRVSSSMRLEEAVIDDVRDEREQVSFDIVTAADISEPRSQWFVDGFDFGVKYLGSMVIRWLNLGRSSQAGSARMIAGDEREAAMFRICGECGKVDSPTRVNRAPEHRPWCSLRNAVQEDTRKLALGRTLRTEGLVVRLPAAISGDQFAVPSLQAALMLGLRDSIGGAPDHLAIEAIVDPVATDGTDNRQALLLHDVVPGGTGYLAGLADQRSFYEVLYRAWEIVNECECAGEGRAACHRCLVPFISGPQAARVSRVAAERHLRSILLGGATEGTPTRDGAWHLTTDSSIEPVADSETELEQRFRKVLRTELENRGAYIREIPTSLGNNWQISLNRHEWSLEPQVQIEGVCQPDFVLRSERGEIPPVAIFCDGWMYHANPAIPHGNRVADDAGKRRYLRDRDFVVLAVTWRDLDHAEADGPPPPTWYNGEAAGKILSNSKGAWKQASLDLIKGGPIELLLRWLTNPSKDELIAIADRLPLLFVGPHLSGLTPGNISIVEVAQHLLAESAVPPGAEKLVWGWKQPTVALAARQVVAGSETTEIAVLLDDRDHVIGAQTKADWHEWLRLSNLLNLRTPMAHITALSLVDSDTGPTVPIPASSPVSEEWVAVARNASKSELALLVELEHAGVPLPEVGHESSAGIPLEISWPMEKVALELGLDDEDRESLANEGWTLVQMDVDRLQDLLLVKRDQM